LSIEKAIHGQDRGGSHRTYRRAHHQLELSRRRDDHFSIMENLLRFTIFP
jgi:hypothetical protein